MRWGEEMSEKLLAGTIDYGILSQLFELGADRDLSLQPSIDATDVLRQMGSSCVAGQIRDKT
jgi:hypothetical protein